MTGNNNLVFGCKKDSNVPEVHVEDLFSSSASSSLNLKHSHEKKMSKPKTKLPKFMQGMFIRTHHMSFIFFCAHHMFTLVLCTTKIQNIGMVFLHLKLMKMQSNLYMQQIQMTRRIIKSVSLVNKR